MFLSLASASQTNLPPSTDETIDTIGRRILALAQTGRCAIFLRQRDGSYTCPWYTGLTPGYIQKILAEDERNFIDHAGSARWIGREIVVLPDVPAP